MCLYWLFFGLCARHSQTLASLAIVIPYLATKIIHRYASAESALIPSNPRVLSGARAQSSCSRLLCPQNQVPNLPAAASALAASRVPTYCVIAAPGRRATRSLTSAVRGQGRGRGSDRQLTPKVPVVGNALAVEVQLRDDAQLEVQRARPRHARAGHEQRGLRGALQVRQAVQRRVARGVRVDPGQEQHVQRVLDDALAVAVCGQGVSGAGGRGRRAPKHSVSQMSPTSLQTRSTGNQAPRARGRGMSSSAHWRVAREMSAIAARDVAVSSGFS